MIKNVPIAVMVALSAFVGASHAQNSYVEAKGSLEWLAVLAQNIDLDAANLGTQVDSTNSTYLSSGELLLRTKQTAWHGAFTYGWKLNETVSLENEVSYGRKNWNDNKFTSSSNQSSTLSAVPVLNWSDTDSDGQVDGGEIAAQIPDQEDNYGSLMINALYTPRLTDEFTMALGMGAGLVYTGYKPRGSTASTGSSDSFLPGYQLKAKLIFEANASTYYLFETGFQAGLPGTSNNSYDSGITAGDYRSSYQHFWTGLGVGYKF